MNAHFTIVLISLLISLGAQASQLTSIYRAPGQLDGALNVGIESLQLIRIEREPTLIVSGKIIKITGRNFGFQIGDEKSCEVPAYLAHRLDSKLGEIMEFLTSHGAKILCEHIVKSEKLNARAINVVLTVE